MNRGPNEPNPNPRRSLAEMRMDDGWMPGDIARICTINVIVGLVPNNVFLLLYCIYSIPSM